MGGILDHDEVMPVGDLPHGLHVARETAVVEDDDRLRPGPDRGLEVRRVEVEVVRADDVAEDRRRACVHDRVRGSHEVERREHDLISRADSGREQGEVQGGGAVRDRQGELDADELAERPLELLDLRPHAPPAGLHDIVHSGPQFIVDLHVGERNAPQAFLRDLFRFHKLPLTWFDKSAIRREYEERYRGRFRAGGTAVCGTAAIIAVPINART